MGEAAMSGCAFCTGEAGAMCAACAKSYDRFQRSTKDRGDVLSSMLWAARHARWFAQRKQGLLPILTDAERAAAMAFVRNELVSYKDKAFGVFEREHVEWATALLAKWIKRAKREAES